MISFIDIHGVEGEITEDLSLTYDGDWNTDVERLIEDVKEQFAGEDGQVESRILFNELMVELSMYEPISEVLLNKNSAETGQ